MKIRTKIWLIAAIVALTVGVESLARLFTTRARIIADSTAAAQELAHDIVDDLSNMDADADDRDLEEKLLGYLNRHSRILRLDLYVDRIETASSTIAVTHGDRPEITRGAPLRRYPLGFTKQAAGGGEAVNTPIVLPVRLKGPWKATLAMRWTLGPMVQMMQTEQRISIIFTGALLIAITLLSGIITNRVVGRPLQVLADAMKDVEAGDLGRRIPIQADDEIGRLSMGFNRMLVRLSQADSEIRAFNQRLAAEIEAATHDLSEKNATLAQLNRLLNEMRLENASKVRLATLGQLAAQLAHEIGTPLSSVSGHLQLARMQRDLPPALVERIDVASREIERISKIVRDYLTSTRPLEPEWRETALQQIIDEAVEITRGVDPSARPPVRAELAADLGELTTDAGLLRQIVVNLLSNALDAVDPKTGLVVVSAAPEGEGVLISVKDNGNGISPENLRRIFEPFYTTKGRGKGTGLGLAICRQLTAVLGGTISVDSEPGAGSTFFVRLPRHGGTGAQQRPRTATGGVA